MTSALPLRFLPLLKPKKKEESEHKFKIVILSKIFKLTKLNEEEAKKERRGSEELLAFYRFSFK
jgi:hypothetical protein